MTIFTIGHIWDKKFYLYVCYKIKDGFKGHYDVEDVESFASLIEAEAFMSEHYAQYVLAIESCDEELWREVRELNK